MSLQRFDDRINISRLRVSITNFLQQDSNHTFYG